MKFSLGAHITRAGSSLERKTGSWADKRPVVDKSKCIKCANCWIFCPDGAIKPVAGGFFEVDPNYCKGCGICAAECPAKAIEMVGVR